MIASWYLRIDQNSPANKWQRVNSLICAVNFINAVFGECLNFNWLVRYFRGWRVLKDSTSDCEWNGISWSNWWRAASLARGIQAPHYAKGCRATASINYRSWYQCVIARCYYSSWSTSQDHLRVWHSNFDNSSLRERICHLKHELNRRKHLIDWFWVTLNLRGRENVEKVSLHGLNKVLVHYECRLEICYHFESIANCWGLWIPHIVYECDNYGWAFGNVLTIRKYCDSICGWKRIAIKDKISWGLCRAAISLQVNLTREYNIDSASRLERRHHVHIVLQFQSVSGNGSHINWR